MAIVCFRKDILNLQLDQRYRKKMNNTELEGKAAEQLQKCYDSLQLCLVMGGCLMPPRVVGNFGHLTNISYGNIISLFKKRNINLNSSKVTATLKG